jgi:hypothetical protein
MKIYCPALFDALIIEDDFKNNYVYDSNIEIIDFCVVRYDISIEINVFEPYDMKSVLKSLLEKVNKNLTLRTIITFKPHKNFRVIFI